MGSKRKNIGYLYYPYISVRNFLKYYCPNLFSIYIWMNRFFNVIRIIFNNIHPVKSVKTSFQFLKTFKELVPVFFRELKFFVLYFMIQSTLYFYTKVYNQIYYDMYYIIEYLKPYKYHIGFSILMFLSFTIIYNYNYFIHNICMATENLSLNDILTQYKYRWWGFEPQTDILLSAINTNYKIMVYYMAISQDIFYHYISWLIVYMYFPVPMSLWSPIFRDLANCLEFKLPYEEYQQIIDDRVFEVMFWLYELGYLTWYYSYASEEWVYIIWF